MLGLPSIFFYNKHMIKAIFLDIDNTLYSHHLKTISDTDLNALKEVQKKGIKIFLATGRSLMELEDLDYKGMTFDGYVTNNGQICYDHNKEIFYDKPIHKDDLKAILPYFIHKEKVLFFVSKYASFINFNSEVSLKAQRECLLPHPPIKEYEDEDIYQIVLYENLKDANDFISLMPHSKMTQWADQGFDIISKDGSKNEGIQATLKHYNLENAEYMAFGDAKNDLEMIEKATIGIAMENACEELKKCAKYITTSVDECGIYHALVKYNLI